MARSKQKSLSQKVVGVATTGMPSPIRKVLTNRVMALLIVLLLPVLFAVGVVSIQWENGRPRLSWDRQRAAEVKQKTAERIEDLRHERSPDQGGLLSVLPHGDQAKPSGFTVDLRPDGKFGNQLEERIDETRDRFGDNNKQRFSLLPASGDRERQDSQATGPLPRLKQLFER